MRVIIQFAGVLPPLTEIRERVKKKMGAVAP